MCAKSVKMKIIKEFNQPGLPGEIRKQIIKQTVLRKKANSFMPSP